MDPYEQRALKTCHQDLMRDIELDKGFLLTLYMDNIITETQKDEIEVKSEQARRSKVAKLLEILPRRGPRAFHNFVTKIKPDYPWLADKLNRELQNERTNLSRDLNDRLSYVINEQLSVLVYGHVRSLVKASTHHPQLAITKLEEVLAGLQQRCYRALDVSSKESNFRDTSLADIIKRKLLQLRETAQDLKSELAEIKHERREQQSSKLKKEITKLKRELNKLKDCNKKHDNSVKLKDKKLQELERDNMSLKIRLDEMEKINKSLIQNCSTQQTQNSAQTATISEMFT